MKPRSKTHAMKLSGWYGTLAQLAFESAKDRVRSANYDVAESAMVWVETWINRASALTVKYTRD